MAISLNPNIAASVAAGAKLGATGLPERMATLMDNMRSEQAATERTALTQGYTPGGQATFKIGKTDWATPTAEESGMVPRTFSEKIALQREQRISQAQQESAQWKGVQTDKDLYKSAQGIINSQIGSFQFSYPDTVTTNEQKSQFVANEINTLAQSMIQQRNKQYGFNTDTVVPGESGEEEEDLTGADTALSTGAAPGEETIDLELKGDVYRVPRGSEAEKRLRSAGAIEV